MKKLKIRGRELVKIGFPEGKVMTVTMQLIHKHYKRSERTEILGILKDLIQNPEKYIQHDILAPVVKLLREKPSIKPGLIELLDQNEDYTVFGFSQIEAVALKQMETAMCLPVTVKGALMPDAHSGYGLPIGGVLATENAIIPFGVGMDIGCRMCLSIYHISPGIIDRNRGQLKEILKENSRFGIHKFHRHTDHEILDRREFREIKILKENHKKAAEQLGTSGSGNHFIDVGYVEIPGTNNDLNIGPGTYFSILSHSGSRNFGATIARYYTQLAKEICILPGEAKNLAWLSLDTDEGTEYWKAMNIAGDYSAANHHIIHDKLSKALNERPIARVENHHNFAWKEKLEDGTEVIVHRKGATPAHKNILGVIPGSMVSPAFIVKGKGNPLSVNSAAHGAGRLMSRAKAKKSFSKKDLRQILEKNNVELIGGGTDEIPGAYKDILKIMQYQKDLVDPVGMFYPKIVIMDNNS